MSDAFSVELTIENRKVVRHESIPFRVDIKNVSSAPIENVPVFNAKNRALVIRLTAEGEASRKADHLTGRSREGLSYHAPDRPVTQTLAPGATISTSGDLLEYFGGIAPGAYTVAAQFQVSLFPVESKPVSLRVDETHPVLAAAPRGTLRQQAGPIANAWVNDEKSMIHTLYYEEDSPRLPSSPRNGRKVMRPFNGADVAILDAAQLPYEDVPYAHLVWQTKSGSIAMAPVDRKKAGNAGVKTLETPFPAGARLLKSSQSMQDGSVCIPLSDATGQNCAAILAGPDGAVRRVERFRAGSKSPVGVHVNLWDYDANLYLAWGSHGAQGGEDPSEVRVVLLPLQSAGSFKSEHSFRLDGPVVWLDGYVHLKEDGSREPILWCVRRKAGSLQCGRYRIAANAMMSDAMLLTEKLPELTPISSAVGYDFNLHILFSGPHGEVFHGNTKASTIKPVLQRNGTPLMKTQFPALIAAGSSGVFAWIHVRYVDATGGRIVIQKLEPANEEDPNGKA